MIVPISGWPVSKIQSLNKKAVQALSIKDLQTKVHKGNDSVLRILTKEQQTRYLN